MSMKFSNALKQLITKDTGIENETKKMAVLIRVLSLNLFFFFIINTIAFGIHGDSYASIGNLILCILYSLIFALSYKLPKMWLVWCFIIVTTAWALSMLWLFGPDSSFQIFPPFLIIIFFFASYDRFILKLIFAFITFVVYQGMSLLYGNREPMLQLSIHAHRCVRDSNMFIMILCTCIAAHVFSNDSQVQENKLIEYNKRLKEKANTDRLTGLNNRGMAMDYLQEFARKADEMICSICICDIDHFKRVNDSYGHDIGDLVLKAVAKSLITAVGDKGFVARWGGEEFFIAFPNMNGDDAMGVLLEVQREVKKAKVNVRDEFITVTLTYGLTEYDKDKKLDENIKDADNKLYLGKEQGRNTIIY
ncbi:MAG: GGDEF domain-containing protein [Lachnospiraceae bacterium]|nr:GGDEF domain-containing protein [Lachnospiraceae bacterium]